MTGADLLVRELQALGVPFISVLCGNGLNPLLAAAAEAGLRLVDTRNEQAVAYIADAYARLTGRLGVCAVSSGVAHVNALAGVLNAHFDGAPMLLISGASSSAYLGRGAFQDVDQVALARPICKWAELVRQPDRILGAVREACAIASRGRPGPVHLTVPVDVLGASVDPVALSTSAATPNQAARRSLDPTALVQFAAQMLAQAHRPIIVAGSGLFCAQAGEALASFAALARIPIVTPIWDRGVIDQPTEEFLGVIGAASGEPELLSRADVILLAGAQVDYRVGCLSSPPLAEDVRIVRVDSDPDQLYEGTVPDLAILADGRTAFEQLAAAWRASGYAGHREWLAEAKNRQIRFYARWDSPLALEHGGVTGAHLVSALHEVMTDETIFLVDGGNIGQWAHMMLCRDRYPSHWLTCGASGVVGWGVPGAMAARLAYPDRPVLLLSGDGAIGFGIAELSSAVSQSLPFVVVVADDQAWGIVASGQMRYQGCTIASQLGPVDYVQVAQGLGARGVRVTDPQDLPEAVRQGHDSCQPTLIHVPIGPGGPTDV